MKNQTSWLSEIRAKLNKPWNMPNSRLLAFFELLFALPILIFTLTQIRKIDWSQSWIYPRESDDPMPWGMWTAFFFGSILVAYHAIAVLRGKRWAIIATAIAATPALLWTLTTGFSRVYNLFQATEPIPLHGYISWLSWFAWAAFYYGALKEGIEAIKKREKSPSLASSVE